jgi:hypothetical protein
MVDYSNYSSDQIQSLILDAVTEVRGRSETYNKLPAYVRDTSDRGDTLKGIAEAADSEYQKAKQSIKALADFNKPREANSRYAVSFQSVVTDVNRYQPVLFASDQEILFGGAFQSSQYDGYLVGFGIQFKSLIPGVNSPISNNVYRRVISFTNGVALLEQPISGATGELTVAILCWPDRVDIPGPVIANPKDPEGSILGAQDPQSIIDTVGDTLDHSDPERIVVMPGHVYIYGVPEGAYAGWSIRFLDGDHKGREIRISKHLQYQEIGDPEPTTYISLQGSIPGGAVAGDWFMLVPPDTEFYSSVDDAFKGMYVQAHATGTGDVDYFGVGIPRQVREVVGSSFNALSIPAKTTAFIYSPSDNTGFEFEYPPIPDTFIGISNNYVELAQLANYLGIYLDDLDPDILQREQIKSAYDFHRLRGTKDGIQLLCRLRGFEAHIEELASTFTPDGGFIDSNVIGSTITVEHQQLPNEELPTDLKVPQNGQGVPRAFVATPAGRAAARIPDSDVNIYLERVNPLAQASSALFQRIAKQLREQALPAHVSINTLGLLQRFLNPVDISVNLDLLGAHTPDIVVNVNELVTAFSVGNGESFVDEPVTFTSSLLLIMASRYDNTRYAPTYNSLNEGVPRWTIGNTRLA